MPTCNECANDIKPTNCHPTTDNSHTVAASQIYCSANNGNTHIAAGIHPVYNQCRTSNQGCATSYRQLSSCP